MLGCWDCGYLLLCLRKNVGDLELDGLLLVLGEERLIEAMLRARLEDQFVSEQISRIP